jgi:hypothetical protein
LPISSHAEQAEASQTETPPLMDSGGVSYLTREEEDLSIDVPHLLADLAMTYSPAS